MTRRETLLDGIRRAFQREGDLHGALQEALDVLCDFLGLHTGWIWLVDPDNGRFYSAAARQLPPFLQRSVRMTGQKCRCMVDFRKGRLTSSNIGLMECSRLERAVRDHLAADSETLDLRFHASIPLAAGSKRVGIVNVAGPEWRELTEDELQILSQAADVISAAVEREQLAETRARLARSQERMRLSRDLHDTLAQGLTGIALHVEAALQALGTDEGAVRERLGAALSATRGHLDELRRSMLDLRAAALEADPLPQALHSLARGVARESGLRVHVHATGDVPLPLRVETELYRIVQEALRNASRHAHATQVDVRLETSADGVTLRVADDGRGFRPGRTRRLGLRGMEERALAMGGTFSLDTAPGKGTIVTVHVPLEQG